MTGTGDATGAGGGRWFLARLPGRGSELTGITVGSGAGGGGGVGGLMPTIEEIVGTRVESEDSRVSCKTIAGAHARVSPESREGRARAIHVVQWPRLAGRAEGSRTVGRSAASSSGSGSMPSAR